MFEGVAKRMTRWVFREGMPVFCLRANGKCHKVDPNGLCDSHDLWRLGVSAV